MDTPKENYTTEEGWQKANYNNCKIIGIRRGEGDRSSILYARLVDQQGQLLISATLDYIMCALKARL